MSAPGPSFPGLVLVLLRCQFPGNFLTRTNFFWLLQSESRKHAFSFPIGGKKRWPFFFWNKWERIDFKRSFCLQPHEKLVGKIIVWPPMERTAKATQVRSKLSVCQAGITRGESRSATGSHAEGQSLLAWELTAGITPTLWVQCLEEGKRGKSSAGNSFKIIALLKIKPETTWHFALVLSQWNLKNTYV